MDLFAKKSTIINAEVLFKNYKKRIKRNQSQNKDKTDIFEANENANIEKNDETIINSDYISNNM